MFSKDDTTSSDVLDKASFLLCSTWGNKIYEHTYALEGVKGLGHIKSREQYKLTKDPTYNEHPNKLYLYLVRDKPSKYKKHLTTNL